MIRKISVIFADAIEDSCKKITSNSIIIFMRNISCGTIFIICIVYLIKIRQSILVSSMKLGYVWMQAKMRKIILNGFHSEVKKMTHMLKK